MTLDEAIEHAEIVADSCEGECADDHAQLADWLRELRQWQKLAEGIDLRPNSLMNTFQPKDLERENAKLRELVRDMWTCIGDGEWDCSHYPPRYVICDDGVSEFRDRARELGVEVDE